MTRQEIVQALRCTSTPGGPTGDCEKYPYWKTEQLTAEQKEKLGVDTWPSCDVDKVGMDAADLIESLTAENAALREKQRWVPVIERMPNTIPCNAGTEYSEAVIVWTNGNKAMIAVWDGTDFICPTDFWGAWGEEITHWMPLPEAPEEGDKA